MWPLLLRVWGTPLHVRTWPALMGTCLLNRRDQGHVWSLLLHVWSTPIHLQIWLALMGTCVLTCCKQGHLWPLLPQWPPVGTTSPRAGLAVHDGSMDATAVCCVSQSRQPVDLPDRALYAACADTCLPAVLATVIAAAEVAYAKWKPSKRPPWPKDRILREIKHIHPAKIVLTGPNSIGTSSTLTLLRHFGYYMHHIANDTTDPRVFTVERFELLVAAWERFCDMEGMVITDILPWVYFYKHILNIVPKLRTVYTARLAPLHLPDVNVLLTATGREVACRQGVVVCEELDAGACVALTQMRNLTLVPGP